MKKTVYILPLFLCQSVFSLSMDQTIMTGIFDGFSVGMAIFCIGRFLSWGVELIKTMLGGGASNRD